MKSCRFFGTLIVFFSVLFVADGIASCEAPEMLPGDKIWYGTHPQVLYTVSTLTEIFDIFIKPDEIYSQERF